jgi:hypothetical protein
MANKDLERLIRKIIKEAPVDYGDYPERMDPRSEKKVEDPESIYAKNRAFRGGASDVERLAGTRFKEIVDYVKRYYSKTENVTDPYVLQSIIMEQQRAIAQALMIEPSHRDKLKDLAVEIAAKEEGWMETSITLDEAIRNREIGKSPIQNGGTKYSFDFIDVDAYLNEKKIDSTQFRMKEKELPKLELPPDFGFDIDELTPEEERQLEIEKRHIINALVQGKGKRGQFAYQAYKDRLDDIDPRLYSIYNKIMSMNDLMYFTLDQMIEMMGGNAAGSSNVESQESDDEGDEGGENVDVVVANGLIFPILLHELVKGFASVSTREQWRGMDPGMAQDVMGKTDVFSNEPMQFRVGAELIRKLRTLLPDDLILNERNKVYIPFFERILYGIPADRFLKEIMANVISEKEEDNDKVRRVFEDLYQRAKKDYQKYKGDSDDEEEDEDEDDILSKLGL